MIERLNRISASLARHGVTTSGQRCEVGLVLGSGLGHLVDAIDDARAIDYAEIDGFPRSTAPLHAGRLVFGTLQGRRVVAMQGRFHLYEGWSARDIAAPVYALQRLGVAHLVVTNAAGGLNASFAPGDVMLIEDHINLMGCNPLTGAHDESLGPRFPDMSQAYWPAHRAALIEQAQALQIPLQRGIYAAVAGPSFETSAERRYLRVIGGDAVGMSTALEVITANHAGIKVLGLSAISNVATGAPDQQPDTIEDVIPQAARAGLQIARLMAAVLPHLR